MTDLYILVVRNDHGNELNEADLTTLARMHQSLTLILTLMTSLNRMHQSNYNNTLDLRLPDQSRIA